MPISQCRLDYINKQYKKNLEVWNEFRIKFAISDEGRTMKENSFLNNGIKEVVENHV
jgi:hypothetical protein